MFHVFNDRMSVREGETRKRDGNGKDHQEEGEGQRRRKFEIDAELGSEE